MPYQAVPISRFLLGAGVVTIPALLLGGDRKWQRGYVFLILLMFAVYHSAGIKQFSAFVQRELAQP